MIISTMKLANGKTEILYCGITIATCDTAAQTSLVCRALTVASATRDADITYWAGKVLKEDAAKTPEEPTEWDNCPIDGQG